METTTANKCIAFTIYVEKSVTGTSLNKLTNLYIDEVIEGIDVLLN